MAFRFPSDTGTALSQGIEQKRAQEEVPSTVWYAKGRAQRFAGEKLATEIGLSGEFGAMAAGQPDPSSKDYLREWTGQWANGPFGPGAMGEQQGVA